MLSAALVTPVFFVSVCVIFFFCTFSSPFLPKTPQSTPIALMLDRGYWLTILFHELRSIHTHPHTPKKTNKKTKRKKKPTKKPTSFLVTVRSFHGSKRIHDVVHKIEGQIQSGNSKLGIFATFVNYITINNEPGHRKVAVVRHKVTKLGRNSERH